MWVDKYAYTTAIHASAQLGKWARSVRYLDEMDATGVKKDVVAVSAAISACADKGQWAQVRFKEDRDRPAVGWTAVVGLQR